jgi:hypothetical protein
VKVVYSLPCVLGVTVFRLRLGLFSRLGTIVSHGGASSPLLLLWPSLRWLEQISVRIVKGESSVMSSVAGRRGGGLIPWRRRLLMVVSLFLLLL